MIDFSEVRGIISNCNFIRRFFFNRSKKMKKSVLAVLISLCVMSSSGSSVNAAEPVLMVIPVHYAMVRLANDIGALRQTYIVSYEKRKDGSLSMYVWDGSANDWIKTDIEAYKSGDIFAKAPAIAFLIGTDADFPSELVDATSFCETKRITTLNAALISNVLNENLNFKKKEWKWLADRQSLQVVDLNEDRRRYGRYGKPGASRSQVPQNVNEMEEEIESLPVTDADKTGQTSVQGEVNVPEKSVDVPPAPQPVPEDADKPAMDK